MVFRRAHAPRSHRSRRCSYYPRYSTSSLVSDSSLYLRRLFRPICVADGLLDQGLFQHVPLCDDQVNRLSSFRCVLRRMILKHFFIQSLFDTDRYPGVLICLFTLCRAASYTFWMSLSVIYTTTSWWQGCTGNSAAFGSDNPLWIAHWASAIGTLPAGWR